MRRESAISQVSPPTSQAVNSSVDAAVFQPPSPHTTSPAVVDSPEERTVSPLMGPTDNDRFCPDDFVTRGQMAAFLKRALS